ncbi:hypothetical protein P1P75_20760 [Streptomyces sp. ID05-39B]|uniref:hypothetical protein n=1 Tax=Streptomyces sp. ID05-39B TaxID=3028664 RepID=UPI0029AD12B6|nr:hypothetical protein [Streptomyces sp. ID05-39B]MDX3528797.1 hypothetical protein [Streptomyces sp. ID05-39B]MDX3528808.1 hypothetical protein [Streptomyces sp. ID05-39B]
MSERHLACVARTGSTHISRQLGGGEAAVIVTILVLAGVLTLTGMPAAEILKLLSWAGLIAVALITMAGASPLRGFSRAVRALLAPANQR